MRIGWIAPLVLVACANGGSGAPDASGKQDAAVQVDAAAPTKQHCGTNELATNISNGQLACASAESATIADVNQYCSVYVGWQDSCDGCTTPPTKWGYVGGDRCMNGAGVDDTCTKPTLDGKGVQLLGINTDGDVNGDDKFYTSLHCTPATSSGSIGPCPAGEFATGTNGVSVRCQSLAELVVSYVSAQCRLFTGWTDSCTGCTTAPTKWGFVGDNGCTNGAGTDNTCSDATMLGTETVKMFGLNTDGNVNDDDKFHIGLACADAAGGSSFTNSLCPVGQFVVGVLSNGSYECQSVAPLISKYVADHCKLYLGWQDSCNGCTTPPTKWGTAKVGACANGAGANDTCTTFSLGSDMLPMFGLNTGGDVDGNDTFYVGFTCE